MKHAIAAELDLEYEPEVDAKLRADLQMELKVARRLLAKQTKAVAMQREAVLDLEDAIMRIGTKMGGMSVKCDIRNVMPYLKAALCAKHEQLDIVRYELSQRQSRQTILLEKVVELQVVVDQIETEAKRRENVNEWIDAKVASHRRKQQRSR